MVLSSLFSGDAASFCIEKTSEIVEIGVNDC